MATRFETSRELQKVSDTPNNDRTLKLGLARSYLEEINTGWRPRQVRIAHAEGAYHVNDELTTESLMYPFQVFGEIILKGTVPRVSCIDVNGRLVVSMAFFDPTILGPTQEIELGLVELDMEMSGHDIILPIGTTLRRPIHVPVEDMLFSMLAA
jgi:hypothetical protein